MLALSMFIPTLLTTLFNLEVSPANVYYISTGRFTAPTVFMSSIQIWGWLSLLRLISGIFVLSIWGSILFPDLPKPYFFACLVLFPLILLPEFATSILQDRQRFKGYNLATLVFPIFQLIFIFLFLWVPRSLNIMAFANYRADMFILNLFLAPASVGI